MKLILQVASCQYDHSTCDKKLFIAMNTGYYTHCESMQTFKGSIR